MKVNTKHATKEVHFQDISHGQIFVYNDEVFMRLDMQYVTYDDHGYEAETWNAVHLESGELNEFHDYDAVFCPSRIGTLEIEY